MRVTATGGRQVTNVVLKDTYKMIFADIDGTIISDDCVITPRTRDAIRYVREKNIPVILVSARPPASIHPVQAMMGYEAPMICFSGALVRDGAGHTLFESVIDAGICDALYRLVRESGLKIVCNTFAGDDWQSENPDYHWIRFEEKHIQLKAGGNFRRDGLPAAHKFQCVGEGDQVAAVEKLIHEHFPELQAGTSIPQFLEIQAADASKVKAIRFLEAYYDIDPTETLAFGDGPVDLEMLKHAGLGVAMGNAAEAVKAAADMVTADNNHDGIADILCML